MTRIFCALVVIESSLMAFAASRAVAESPTLLGAEYRADTAFPEFMPLWREGWSLRDKKGDLVRYAKPEMQLGGYLHAFIRNSSSTPMEIKDVAIEGIGLIKAVASDRQTKNKDDRFFSSIAFAKLTADQTRTLQSVGEPVWWKADPFVVPARGSAEIVIRLRRVPRLESILLTIITSDGDVQGKIIPKKPSPHIVSIGFSPKRDHAYVYLRNTNTGIQPRSMWIDGEDMTGKTTFESDPGQIVLPAVVVLNSPVQEGEYHLFEVQYSDQSKAQASIRVDRPDFVYGMWGGFSIDKDSETLDTDGASFIEHLRSHNINTIMSQFGGNVRKFIRSPIGQQMCAQYGIRIMDHTPDMFPNQRYIFLNDEPDAADVRVESLPLDKRIGARGQWLVQLGREYRAKSPNQLQLLNIDNTFKPENWYTYAQLPDLPCADPYYQEQMHSVYLVDPGNLPAYIKPTYVYAVGAIYQSACAPKPMHLILHACRHEKADDYFRPPTPEEKRIELYYSIAAGARGISFWWYTPSGIFHGIGSDAPDMRRLFAEVGLVGAEIRTAEPILSRACPAPMELRTSPMLWARALLAGSDTLVLVIANDNIGSDRSGTSVQPLPNARVSFKPPTWLKVKDTFEVASSGIKDVGTKTQDANLVVELGRVDLTRLIVVTADAQLRTQLKRRYDAQFAETARKLLAEAGPREVKQYDKSQEQAAKRASKKKKKD